jgi:hypothetical protein
MAASSSTTSTVWLGESTATASLPRTPIPAGSVYSLKVRNEPGHSEAEFEREIDRAARRIPRPSPQFRRRSWLAFQRALDPFAQPKPLRGRRQH